MDSDLRVRLEAAPGNRARYHPRKIEANEGEPPFWLWLAFLGAGALALCLVCWGAYSTMSEEKIFLRIADKGSTLGMSGIKGAVATGQTNQQQSEPIKLAWQETEEPPLPPPLVVPPPLPRATPLPPPLPALVAPPVSVPFVPPPMEVPFPVVHLDPPPQTDNYPWVFTRPSLSEDSPMLRNWKMLALYSLTVVTLTQPAPVVAGGDQKTLIDRLDKLEKSIVQSFDNLGGDIKALNAELGQFKKDIGKLQSDITGLQTESLDNKIKINGFSGKFDALEKQVRRMQADMDALRKRLDSEPERVATPLIDKSMLDELKGKLSAIEKAILGLQAPTSRIALSPSTTPPASTGRVMLVNNYPETLLFIINEREFRVPGMTTQPIDGVPSGSLNYEVISPTWGLRARRTTSLAASETFTLTAQ